MGRDALPFSIFKNCLKKPIRGLPNSLDRIGDHLRKRRLELGMLQKEVADCLQVCEDSICGWEMGRSSPMIHHYPAIISFLGYNPYLSNENSIGKRILAYRLLNGLSNKTMGKFIGVDGSTILSWESGRMKPTSKSLKKLEVLLI